MQAQNRIKKKKKMVKVFLALDYSNTEHIHAFFWSELYYETFAGIRTYYIGNQLNIIK